jgi:hypothetical protein
MSQAIWTSQTGGDWSDPDNWQGTIVPGPGDSVTIASTVAETITISTAVSVQSLTIDDPAATIDLLNSGTIIAAGDVDISAADADLGGTIKAGGTLDVVVSGSISVFNAISAKQVDISAGVIETLGMASVQTGTLVDTGGVLLTTGSLTNGVVTTAAGGITDDGFTLGSGALIATASTVITPGDVVFFDLVVSCFAAGTRIATPDGPVTVEQLATGDTVTLAAGGTAPIVWIGQRRVDCRRHPAAERVWPVRVEAHAFGLGRPHAPLFLSPDHAVFVDEVLVPVKLLVNGATIRQIPMAEVTYFHIELARHDVVLAEGLPVETYLDTGDRVAFGGDVMALHPAFGAPEDLALVWEQKGVAPLIPGGAALDRIRARLAVQASLLESETSLGRLTKTS